MPRARLVLCVPLVVLVTLTLSRPLCPPLVTEHDHSIAVGGDPASRSVDEGLSTQPGFSVAGQAIDGEDIDAVLSARLASSTPTTTSTITPHEQRWYHPQPPPSAGYSTTRSPTPIPTPTSQDDAAPASLAARRFHPQPSPSAGYSASCPSRAGPSVAAEWFHPQPPPSAGYTQTCSPSPSGTAAPVLVPRRFHPQPSPSAGYSSSRSPGKGTANAAPAVSTVARAPM